MCVPYTFICMRVYLSTCVCKYVRILWVTCCRYFRYKKSWYLAERYFKYVNCWSQSLTINLIVKVYCNAVRCCDKKKINEFMVKVFFFSMQMQIWLRKLSVLDWYGEVVILLNVCIWMCNLFIQKQPTRCNSVSEFIIPCLYEARHVSGDTPPVMRSSKLH